MFWLGSLQSRIIVLVAMVTVPALFALWIASEVHRTEARATADARLSQLAIGTAPYLPIVIPFTAYSPDRTQTFEHEFIAAVELGGFGIVAARFSLDEEGGIIVLFDHLGRLLVRHPVRDEFLGRVVGQVTRGLQGRFSEVPVVAVLPLEHNCLPDCRGARWSNLA